LFEFDHPDLEAPMAEVLLFHHAQGLTPGVIAFADELRAAGHTVHTPDLFDGRTFASIDEGMAHIKKTGFDDLRARGVRTADDLPAELVYAGFSFGESIAQELTQTRPGARGALLFYSAIPISGEWAFGPWPDGVPVQIHGMDNDPIFVGEGDIDAAREIVEKVDDAELFLYPGDQHYFSDSSLPSYDAEATALLTKRVLEFLDRV
jgi:dienelactone hydrolase